ncbi:MAG TPA: hypothetical protein DHV08_15590 [Rhodocyclaceae bacterium]|nr:MAG: hypothetical protein AUK49_10945 [Betaproteobacteria bacterium CG2_30_68_42]PIV72006.1 MAG: hypothetical protein COW56_11600 [Rhodocyclales bacterium CG17_big_fil_post_rev_8_21_14_2_50_68_7]PIX74508.1 MAG: hypothetical protein COZ38_10145 [Rhodocyclales bacterium CG_4_10_14_3_um_filter_68_10]PJA57102.1 MAG: hypothetical protein CO164_09555 [Rhodocyclales bacterium CG_4_9_14_3_um_filter_68_10]HCX34824.1 hypothetical protein [Rhodocyclaceae bacterium]
MNRILSEAVRKYNLRYPARLAAGFPHVESAISLMWGSPEIYRYFDKLMIADRNDREGFPPEVIQEILALRSLHEKLYPARAGVDLWGLCFQK